MRYRKTERICEWKPMRNLCFVSWVLDFWMIFIMHWRNELSNRRQAIAHDYSTWTWSRGRWDLCVGAPFWDETCLVNVRLNYLVYKTLGWETHNFEVSWIRGKSKQSADLILTALGTLRRQNNPDQSRKFQTTRPFSVKKLLNLTSVKLFGYEINIHMWN